MTVDEKIHMLSKRGDDAQLIDYVGDNKNHFKSLINMYVAGPLRITQRLAAPLTAIATRRPALLTPHYTSLIKGLNDATTSTAFKRNTIKMFQFVPVPQSKRGHILDICFRFLHDKKETIAVKVFAMSVAELLTRDSNELRRELQIVIEDQLPYSGPAFRSRAAKVLRKLKSPL